MKKIDFKDVLNIIEYEKVRNDFRKKIIELKKKRRLHLGDRISFVFENRETVLSQIQEMMRTERIVDDDKIQHEIDTYNDLIPADDELSATMFLEITDQTNIRNELNKLIGIDEKICMKIGNEYTIRAIFEPGRSKEDKISSVHYVKFKFTLEQIAAFRNPENAVLIVSDHANYKASQKLSEELRESLVEDLATK